MTATSLPQNPSPPSPSRGPRILYRAMVLLLFTELVLQALAFISWNRRETETHSGARSAQTVLCIGDSLTHGTGATRPTMAYPAQLGRRLQDQTDHEWNVINDGWPGRNSRQVAARIRDQLETFNPGTVCLLVGANDFWSTPDRLEPEDLAAAPDTGFPFRFRLGLITSIAWHMIFDDAGPAAAMAGNASHPFLGAWHNDQLDLRFSPNGHLTLGALEGHWYLHAGSLELHLGNRDLPTQWKVEGDSLELEGAWPTKLQFERGDSGVDRPVQDGWHAIHSGDLDAAMLKFERALKQEGREADARLGMIHVQAARKNGSEVDKHIAWFLRHTQNTATPSATAKLVDAYIEANKPKLAIENACALMLRDPTQFASWRALARYGERAEFRDIAQTTIDTILESSTVSSAIRIDLLRSRASLLRQPDPRAALISHLRALLLDKSEIHLVLELRRHPDTYSKTLFESCVNEVSDDPTARESLISLYDKASAGVDDSTPKTLAHHLKIVVDACRAQGATVVLLTYPYYAPRVEAIVNELCREDGVRQANVRARFDQLLIHMAREDLFVLDGHCNDRGYTAMAELIADQVLKR